MPVDYEQLKREILLADDPRKVMVQVVDIIMSQQRQITQLRRSIKAMASEPDTVRIHRNDQSSPNVDDGTTPHPMSERHMNDTAPIEPKDFEE